MKSESRVRWFRVLGKFVTEVFPVRGLKRRVPCIPSGFGHEKVMFSAFPHYKGPSEVPYQLLIVARCLGTSTFRILF